MENSELLKSIKFLKFSMWILLIILGFSLGVNYRLLTEFMLLNDNYRKLPPISINVDLRDVENMFKQTNQKLQNIEDKIDDRKVSNVKNQQTTSSDKIYHVSMSAYTNHPSENGPWKKTYSGTNLITGTTVAVSHDLKHLMGKRIYIHGIGERVVQDLMAKRWNNTIDILMSSRSETRKFGRRKGKITVLE